MKQSITPAGFSKTLGAYSHGVVVDVGDSQMIFTTGQLAMDSDGKPVAAGDIGAQTEYVFENIKKILAEAGATIDDIVKVVVYVTNVDDFPKISAVRNRYLSESKPVSTLVQIARTVTPGCDIEIDVIAVRKK